MVILMYTIVSRTFLFNSSSPEKAPYSLHYGLYIKPKIYGVKHPGSDKQYSFTMVFGPKLYCRGTMTWQLCPLEKVARGDTEVVVRSFWT